MHTTSRSVVAAARAHPAGVAAPSAVIVTAIVLLTFVASVIVHSISPSLFGGGSAPVLQPNPSQPRHRVLPLHPVPTGECGELARNIHPCNAASNTILSRREPNSIRNVSLERPLDCHG